MRAPMAELPLTRASLLLRLRDPRNETAWRDFMDLYAPVVYGYLRKQSLQDADAADLTQDIFLTLTSAVGRFDYDPSRGSFRNWLFTVVRRKLWNWRRDRQTVLDSARAADSSCIDGSYVLATD